MKKNISTSGISIVLDEYFERKGISNGSRETGKNTAEIPENSTNARETQERGRTGTRRKIL